MAAAVVIIAIGLGGVLTVRAVFRKDDVAST
jgi:hypothetical protein